jgi:hypothetical protein
MTAQPMMSMAAAQAGLNAITALINVGSPPGKIKIYSGSAPATVETSASGTLLSSGIAFSTTAFGAATDPGSTGLATATANTIAADTNAANSGTAGYFRATNAAGTAILQGTCGTSSADMIMNTTTITAGDTIAISSFVITLPDGSGAD